MASESAVLSTLAASYIPQIETVIVDDPDLFEYAVEFAIHDVL